MIINLMAHRIYCFSLFPETSWYKKKPRTLKNLNILCWSQGPQKYDNQLTFPKEDLTNSKKQFFEGTKSKFLGFYRLRMMITIFEMIWNFW
ncbi:hypothetical protein BpHYR1_022370 [Brachionus plicatilis]|uniref:Uncharacterized protein n=1 Tax=Brachionus plicatilis TaxID=10195 RepID=A0A3M7PHI3_BRAPC|nr:hypothetical protein BpHYR1_022370 [Brachionus plicatilis]